MTDSQLNHQFDILQIWEYAGDIGTCRKPNCLNAKYKEQRSRIRNISSSESETNIHLFFCSFISDFVKLQSEKETFA